MNIFPTNNERLITSVIISFFFGAIVGFFVALKNIDSGVIITAIATLAAAFSGSWLAYFLQNKKEIEKKAEKQKSELNKAIFTLARQINALAIYKQTLDNLENDPSRHFKVKPWQTNSYSDLCFNVEQLNFLIGKEDPNILFDLLIEQERFEQAMSTIKLRSKYQVETIQPLLEKADIVGKLISLEEAENVFGKEKLQGLVMATDEVYSHVNRTYKSSVELQTKLVKHAKKLYPNGVFIKFG